MRKYSVFGFISGVVVSLIYPEYYMLISFGEHMGVDRKWFMLMVGVAYIVSAVLILYKLKSEFAFKHLFLLLICGGIGSFIVIVADKLLYSIFPLLSIRIAGIRPRVAFADAFNFRDIHILSRYIGQSMLQFVSYILACFVYKVNLKIKAE